MNKLLRLSFLILLLMFIGVFQLSAQNIQNNQKLYHVLLIDWNDSMNQDQENEVIELFKNLPSKIDGFETISFNKLIMSTEDFETQIVMIFLSEEALNEYQQHPDHLQIKKMAPEIISKLSKFDYWK